MIKNFIYLDEPKLYSFSSQLFEGVTEYVLNEQHLEHTDQETQKGKLASGKIIADVIRETSSSTTKKFLHDYSFNLFEKKLEEENKLLDITSLASTEDILSSTSDYSFVKIKAQMLIADTQEVIDIFRDFNRMGENILISQMQNELTILEHKHANSNIKDKDSAVSKEFFRDNNIEKMALDANLRQPKLFQRSIIELLELGQNDALQFHQLVHNTLFSSYLDRDHLREPLKSIIKKYSRLTQKDFVVLGVISHKCSDDPFQESHPLATVSGIPDMKSRMRALSAAMIGISKFTYGLEHNEIVIEPVAIYTEL
ncbi:hypothetical protein CGH87_05330 [Vibrio parahaemolyticus]|uniref:DUF6414 family protein n=1 Tax=Vibrio parahaemolyticus TaxID=670 RepID=UPI00054212AA|nr:hypothetical protein [Vibrio parahaemolyticus]EGR3300061.1 hypothetical protein [Vibrio parahaemolyticus]EGR3317000.1 hypothetical protein [Vibrio parahaemolyticus]KHF03830.1 hypothetical protein PO77_21355 [Vibrio parahaemolyticus]TOM01830.1 hypothetical protein CGH87_05330 [Vibrio parahaemolyticus]